MDESPRLSWLNPAISTRKFNGRHEALCEAYPGLHYRRTGFAIFSGHVAGDTEKPLRTRMNPIPLILNTPEKSCFSREFPYTCYYPIFLMENTWTPGNWHAESLEDCERSWRYLQPSIDQPPSDESICHWSILTCQFCTKTGCFPVVGLISGLYRIYDF